MTTNGKRREWKMVNSATLLAVTIFYSLFTPFAVSADTSGASFLKVGDGARPLALGGAYTAHSGSVDSLYYNPGGTASLDGQELSVTHSDWLGGTTFNVVSYGHELSLGTLAVSALRVGGEQEGRDANRLATGNFSTEDLSLLISYSRKLASIVSAGANVKYLRSRIDHDSASTVALDVGAVGKVPNLPVSVGASVLNMGSGLRFVDQVDRLPLTIAVGALYEPIQKFGLSLDFKHEPHAGREEFATGAQYSVGPFDFRMGYIAPVGGTDDNMSTAEHVRGGLGLKISRYRADYTLAPFGDLGLTQRFTLSITFGGSAQNPKNLQTPLQNAKALHDLALLSE